MSKISELPPITGSNTRSEDLFVIVNLVQGDDGTSSITRKELVQAIQYEIFDRITITGGTISGVIMSDSRLDNVIIDNSDMEDSDIIRSTFDDGELTNSTGDNLDIENSTFDDGAIGNTTFTDGEIFDSTANNVTITNSSFTDGEIFDSTGNNMVITNSELNDSTANNVVITDSQLNDSTANNVVITNSELNDSTGNNVVLTNSELNDSTANNVVITNSEFNDGTGNNVVLTNSTIDDSTITDSSANNVTITQSTFADGALSDSTANNITMTSSVFDDGEILDSTANNLIMTSSQLNDSTANNSTFTNSALNDSTANNVAITNSTLDYGIVRNTTISSSELNDSTANNVTITDSDFSDGTGNNNIFTNTTIDEGIIQNSEITDSTFTGSMQDVVAQNMTITSSTASDFSQSKSSFDDGNVTKSTFSDGVIDQSKLVDFDMELENQFEPSIDENSWFALKNEKTGETERITYKQFFDEISKTTQTDLKIHVDASKGDDANPGTVLQPIRTLERASELAIEKAGGNPNRNAINNAIHISVGPGTYYTKGNIALPDDCAMTATAGQYATVIEALPGYENNNAVLVGSGCYVQGFAYQNWKIDNFDFPEGGFACAYRPGAKLLRSPYIRDSSQLSNFLREDVEPPLQPFNSKGTVDDLGRAFILEPGFTGQWLQGDEITFSSGAKGYISWDDDLDTEKGLTTDIATNRRIHVRNLKNNKGFAVGDTVRGESGGVGVIQEIGDEDFPNPLVGRGGGCMLADRRVLDPDSLYTYVLCFGFTPRSQNGIGYVARDGAGVNGIGSLSIFVRVAFYALNGGQMTLNNSGTQFGDISMRAKGTTEIFAPKDIVPTAGNTGSTYTSQVGIAPGTEVSSVLVGNTAFADAISEAEDTIIEDMVEYLTANTADGGLGYTGYDADKCERDSGIIIDGAAYDISLDTNYWGRLAGITYRSPISSKVVGEQLEATLGANQYLQSRIEDLFEGEVITRANTSFQELYNVLEYGEENMNPIIFADTGNSKYTSAREIIQDNREFIQGELLDWIDNNEEFFAYDSVKCKRDTTEYILPAAKYDMLLDTNYNAVRAGGAYFMKSAEKVAGQQRNETVAAYRRLKDQTNEIIDANSFIATTRVDAAFDEIIDTLDYRHTKYTPTNATYEPTTGLSVITIGAHDLSVGRKILIAEGGITFSCGTDGNVINISHPRPTDPAFKSPIEILETTATTITVNVGKSFYTGEHTFVSALNDAVIELGSEITFSDNTAIDVNKRNARSQLQANRTFMQDLTMGYIDNNYFRYDSEKCTRDMLEYILPAVERDLITGTNFNALQTGIGYRQGTQGAETVVREQLTETVGAIEHLKSITETTITDTAARTRTNDAFDQIIDIINNNNRKYTPTGATYDPITGVMGLTIGAHDLQEGDTIILDDESITFTCALDGNATQHSYPQKGHPAYRTPVTINSVTATGITVNVGGYENGTAHTFVSATANSVRSGTYISGYTPSTATYDHTTGVFVATIGQHNISVGDFVQIKPESVVFTCTLDGNATEHAAPQAHHPAYRTPVEVTAVTSDSITVNIGAGPGGVHTFVSAEVGAIDADPIVWTDPARYVKYYTPTTATYDPATGLSVITMPGHDLTTDDYIEFAPYSFVYTCAQDGDATEHAYPRKGDSNYNKPMQITNVAGDDVTVQLAASSGGTHTFVSVLNNAVAKVTHNSQGQLAREQLQANRQFLQEEVMHHLDSLYFVFDGDKCSRDTGLILDSVRRDIITGSNFSSVFSGLAYRAGTTSGNYVISDQLAQTSAAIGFVRDEANQYLSGTALTRSTAAFNEIIDVLENGQGNADAITYTAQGIGTQEVEARQALQANKAFLQAEVTAWLTANYPGLTYDSAKCERDVGYLVDSVSFDVQYGGNSAAVNNARLYYSNAVAILPEDQRVPTARAFERLAEVADEIVRGVSVVKTAGNAQTQDTSFPTGGTAEELLTVGSRTYKGFALVATMIQEANFDSLPEVEEVTYRPADATLVAAFNDLDGVTESLQGAVIKYLVDEHNGLPYNKDKCYRDVGLITDAISKDIEYGGNASTIEAAKYYFSVDHEEGSTYEQLRVVNKLPIPVTGQFSVLDDLASVSGLREATNILPIEQRIPTKQAFQHLASVAEKVVKEVAHTTTWNQYTPSSATYDPATGVFTAEIGAHSLLPGDKLWLKPNSITFSCDMGSGPANHTSPQAHHPYYNAPVTITAVTATGVTMNVGTGGSGQQPHTFVSADANSISEGPYQNTDGTAANAATGTAVSNLYGIIANLVDDNDLDNLDTTEVKPLADPNRTVARKQIQVNRDFIIEEIIAYLNDEYFTFDGEKCKRDVGIILDAVKRDTLTGSNYNAIFNGLAYRSGTVGANAVIEKQLTETVSAINYAKNIAIAAITDSAAKTRATEAFDEIIDIMGNNTPDSITWGGTYQSITRLNSRVQLQNNKAFLQAEMTAWLAQNRPSLTYDVAKCERDLGYIIDSVSYDMQHGGNVASRNNAILYFENAVSVLPLDQREPTAAAFNHIANVVEQVVQEQTVTPTPGNGVSQDFSGGNGLAADGARAKLLVNIISEAISENGLEGLPDIEESPTGVYGSGYISAFSEIESTKTTIQEGVLSHLSVYFNTLTYDETKCRRDTGYIIDAVSHDIQYGGNAATVNAAGIYFENAVSVLPVSQRHATRDAFLHLAKVMNHVTREIVVEPTVGNNLTQDFREVAANPLTGEAVQALAEIVANTVDDAIPSTANIPAVVAPETRWVRSDYTDAVDLIEEASTSLASQVIDYISTTYNGLSFPEFKCRRDIGYLIDAVSHDVQYGGNYATRIAAGIYFENGISVLPADTRTQTADVYAYLGTVFSGVVTETDVSNTTYTDTTQDTSGTPATATEAARAAALIGYVEDVIRENTLDVLPTLEEPDTYWISQDLLGAAQQIDSNRYELANDLVEFLRREFTVLDYNRAKCQRDTGYLLDAFSFDLNYGGNTASRWNADFYFWNNLYRIPEDQRVPTALSYKKLGEICKDVVLGNYPGQVVKSGTGTIVEANKVQELANIFYLTQINNDTKYLPATQEPGYDWIDDEVASVVQILEFNRSDLAFDTVRYVNATYRYIDINLTRRDGKNLLKAIRQDFSTLNPSGPPDSLDYTQNGDRQRTRAYTAALFDQNGKHVFPVFNATTPGLRYQGSVANVGDLATITGQKPYQAYIVATDLDTNFYEGNIYYWGDTNNDGVADDWILDGANNTELLDAFVGAWENMRDSLVNLSPDAQHTTMIKGLINNCLIDNVLRPETLTFGALVESIAHQFNGASAGVNRNALPLNFRNLGLPISALASVLQEDGGRIRWSGADELNNQYFARGLRINGRTGRIEGRPFTSSVRKLARRASNSRASI